MKNRTMGIKKALIISTTQIEVVAGVEKYNKKLINILNNLGYEITEYALVGNKENIYENIKYRYWCITSSEYINKSKFFKLFGYRRFLEKNISNFLKDNDFDLIINSTNVAIKDVMWNSNYIWVQHYDTNFIKYACPNKTFKEKIKGTIFSLLLFLFHQFVPLEKSKNIVTYYKGYIPKKYMHDNINYFYVTLSTDNFLESINNLNFKEKKKKNFVYIGRIEDRQKNISFLINNFSNIDYYGPIVNKQLEEKISDNYKGIINNKDTFREVFENSSFLILSSKFDGFPAILVESLAYATPIISSDKIIANEFFFKDKKVGFILDINKKPSLDTYLNISDEEYKQLCLNAFDMANKNFRESIFDESWIKIINKVSN